MSNFNENLICKLLNPITFAAYKKIKLRNGYFNCRR